jgi:hypothetical protein
MHGGKAKAKHEVKCRRWNGKKEENKMYCEYKIDKIE